MDSDPPSEPWLSFLKAIDDATTADILLHCFGGFAVSLHYGFARSTNDIDVVEVVPGSAKPWLVETAGEGSALHRRFKVYLQIVTVATVPYSYEERLIEIFRDQFRHLRLFVLDPYDLALSKITRNLDVDIEDVKHLARSSRLDLDTLESRYTSEVRPFAPGPPERHDLTLKLWLEAIREERGVSPP